MTAGQVGRRGSLRRPGRGGGSWVRAWLGDSSTMLVSQVLTVVATSVAAISIARILHPDDWGIFSAFLGLSLAVAIVSDFGLATWLLRELSRLAAEGAHDAPARAGRLISGALAINVTIGVPLWVGAVLWGVLAGAGAATLGALLALLIYGTSSASGYALETYLRSRREVRLVVGVSVLEKTLLLAMLVVVAVLGAGLGGIGLAYLVAGLTRVALDCVLVFGRRDVPPSRPTGRELRTIVVSSFPFALTAGSLNVIPRLDTLLLVTLSTTAAAWFAIGDRVTGPALLVPATLGATLYPFLARSDARKTAPWKLSAAMGAAGFLIAGLGIALTPFLVPLVFGEDYEDAVAVTQIMLLMLPLVYATSPFLASAYSRGAEWRLVLPVIGISLVGSVAIVLGEALAGAEGAATGLLIRSLLFLVFIGAIATSTARNDALVDARLEHTPVT